MVYRDNYYATKFNFRTVPLSGNYVAWCSLLERKQLIEDIDPYKRNEGHLIAIQRTDKHSNNNKAVRSRVRTNNNTNKHKVEPICTSKLLFHEDQMVHTVVFFKLLVCFL